MPDAAVPSRWRPGAEADALSRATVEPTGLDPNASEAKCAAY